MKKYIFLLIFLLIAINVWAIPPKGNVTGPSSSIDNALVRFDGTTGKLIQNYTSGDPTCGDTGECIFKFLVNTSEIDNGNCGSADTIDWNAGNKQKTTLTAATCTLTFTAPTSGVASLLLKIVQDGTGSRLVSWPSTVRWPGGTTPTLTTTANHWDICTFYWDGTVYNGGCNLNYAP
ncbi:MAG: hypothetical protein ACOYWZ_20180 [Bacillota bacterium]